jgi:hypothetical protein
MNRSVSQTAPLLPLHTGCYALTLVALLHG